MSLQRSHLRDLLGLGTKQGRIFKVDMVDDVNETGYLIFRDMDNEIISKGNMCGRSMARLG